MKPPAKPAAVKSVEELAAILVNGIGEWDRNCRCPQCMQRCLRCVDCEWCRANLLKLLTDGMTAAPFFVCNRDRDQVIVAAMKKTPKSKSRIKAKAKTKATANAKKPQLVKNSKRVATMNRKGPGPKSGDSDRGLYVRFDSPEIKAKVKAAADHSKVSMNAYIVAATLGWVKEGKQVPAPEDAKEAVA